MVIQWWIYIVKFWMHAPINQSNFHTVFGGNGTNDRLAPPEVCTATLNDNTTKSCAVGREYKSNQNFWFLHFFVCLIRWIYKFKPGKTSTPMNFYVFRGLPGTTNERKEYFSVCEICWVSLATRLFNMAVDYFDAKKYPCYSWVLFVRGTQISFFLGRSIYIYIYFFNFFQYQELNQLNTFCETI